MARRTDAGRSPILPPRLLTVLLGAVIGAAWGLVLWLAGGGEGGGALTMQVVALAMIGGGVAAIFETVRAKRRGERLYPKLPYRRWRNR